MRTYASFRRPATCAFTTIALFLTVLSAHAGTLTPIKLRVSGKEVALNTPAVCDGHEVYVPLDCLKYVGAGFSLTAREETVIVALPGGPAIEVALARPGPHVMIPLSGLIKGLDVAAASRDRACDIRLINGRLVQDIPTPPKPPDLKPKPPEPVVRKQEDAATPPATNPAIRADAWKSDQASQEIQQPGALDNGKVGKAQATPAQPATGTAAPAATVPPKPALVHIDGIDYEPTSKNSARIHIRTSGKVAATTTVLSDPARLAIDIANSELGTDTQHTATDNPFLSAIHAGPGDRPGLTRVILDLSRQVSYRLMPPDSTGVTLNIGTPNPTKRLSDLTIVLDPGHGGSEGTNPIGASVVINGKCIMEKNLTLSIAQKVRAILEDEGAQVIMTRTTDRSVPLPARPALAKSNNADMFVSIHIDDCEHPDTASGTTAYYPGQDGRSRNLAKSIVDRVASVSGLPNRRARSDRERFAGSGMAVLHCGGIPCTLVEMGYLNNARDRDKLTNPEFQETVARAIVDGIQDHLMTSGPEPVAGPVNPSHPMDRIGAE